MKYRLFLLPFAFTLLVAAGCLPTTTSVDYATLNPEPHPMLPRDPNSVEVFIDTRPTRPYVEVGVYDLENVDRTGTMSDLLNALRRNAGANGCDAAVLRLSDSDRRRQAICIAYTDAPAPTPPAAPAAPAAT